MVLREATSDDFEELTALYRAQIGRRFCLWNEHYPTSDNIETDILLGNMFVAVSDGHIVGAVAIDTEDDLSDFDFWRFREDCCDLARLCVSPDHSGQGIGYRIMTDIDSLLRDRGYSAVHLLVGSENVPAYKTHMKAGYKKCGECNMYGSHYYACEKKL
ncbi:MAG: GNAT family N-acetyltransferase [Clostridia bacterium]|nr:GNAT family N-acetyltransferase [Clostridia bacterium]